MKANLKGKRVALLVTEGFEQAELTSPKEALEKAGAQADIVSPAGDTVRAWDEKKWGETFDVDVRLNKEISQRLPNQGRKRKMKTYSNETNVDVAWCPFVAFRIAIRRGNLQKLPDSWPAPGLTSWPGSAKRGRLGSLKKVALKRKRNRRPGSLWG